MIKARIHTTMTDRGFEKWLKELEYIKGGSYVQVGVQSSAAPPKGGGGLTMAQLATIHEFGTKRAGKNHDIVIPQRSFIRSTMDEQNSKFTKVTKEVLADVADGHSTVKKALSVIGLVIETAIKKKITDLKDPPNAPSTIAAKGSDNPLIDTGRMRASIRYKVVLEKETVNRTYFKQGDLTKK